MSLTLRLLLLLLLILSHVDSGSVVKFLPGFEGPLPFELETGYIGIGEEEDVQLFYYFIKSEKNPKEDPLLIWLNGGPGCSTLSGLLFENGPVALKFEVYNGTLVSLVSTTYSWTQVANIIFLDQPVGAGFSYSSTPLDKTSDTNEVKMIHEFIQKTKSFLGSTGLNAAVAAAVAGVCGCGLLRLIAFYSGLCNWYSGSKLLRLRMIFDWFTSGCKSKL